MMHLKSHYQDQFFSLEVVFDMPCTTSDLKNRASFLKILLGFGDIVIDMKMTFLQPCF